MKSKTVKGAIFGFLLLGGVALLGSCSHTLISTNDHRAKIFVDGQYIGTGSGKIKRVGFPKTSNILVKSTRGKKQQKIEREFTLRTMLAGAFSYFTGFLWAWEFPEHVMIMLPTGAAGCSVWDKECKGGAGSVWDRGTQ